MLPKDIYPPYQTCHRYFQKWVRQGVMQRLLFQLSKHYVQKQKTPMVSFIDGSFSLPKKGDKVGKTMKGKGSKIMAMTTGSSRPFSLMIESATPHECRLAEQTIENRFAHQQPLRLVADRAYDNDPLGG